MNKSNTVLTENVGGDPNNETNVSTVHKKKKKKHRTLNEDEMKSEGNIPNYEFVQPTTGDKTTAHRKKKHKKIEHSVEHATISSQTNPEQDYSILSKNKESKRRCSEENSECLVIKLGRETERETGDIYSASVQDCSTVTTSDKVSVYKKKKKKSFSLEGTELVTGDHELAVCSSLDIKSDDVSVPKKKKKKRNYSEEDSELAVENKTKSCSSPKKEKRKKSYSLLEPELVTGDRELAICGSLFYRTSDDVSVHKMKKMKKKKKYSEEDSELAVEKKMKRSCSVEEPELVTRDNELSECGSPKKNKKKKRKRRHSTDESVLVDNVSVMANIDMEKVNLPSEQDPPTGELQKKSTARKKKKKKVLEELYEMARVESESEIEERKKRNKKRRREKHQEPESNDLSNNGADNGHNCDELTVGDVESGVSRNGQCTANCEEPSGSVYGDNNSDSSKPSDRNGPLNLTMRKRAKDRKIEADNYVLEDKASSENSSEEEKLLLDHRGSLTCYMCQGEQRSGTQLARHLAKEHNISVYQCPRCSARLSTHTQQKRHMKVSCKRTEVLIRRFWCTLCPMKFVKNSQLTLHLGVQHGQAVRYSCQFCHRNFTCPKHLNMHLVLCREGLIRKEVKKANKECSKCGKLFASQKNLNTHTRAIHLHVHFLCLCGQRFMWDSKYYRHIKLCKNRM